MARTGSTRASKPAFRTLAAPLFAPLAGLHAADPPQPRPNIVFIFTDDQPQAALGCMGNSHVETPNMDRLAREGVLFENSFVTTAICCVSRASLLTGRHAVRHGIDSFTEPLSEVQYPMLFREAGYRTAFLGKLAAGDPTTQPRGLRAAWYYEHDCDTKSDGKPLPRCEGVRTDCWKYVRSKDTQPLQGKLFDLRSDPLEEHNLATDATHGKTLSLMSSRCDELRASLR